jgi:hypothetical protein
MKFNLQLGDDEITTNASQRAVYHISHIDTKMLKLKWYLRFWLWIRRLCARLSR